MTEVVEEVEEEEEEEGAASRAATALDLDGKDLWLSWEGDVEGSESDEEDDEEEEFVVNMNCFHR